MTSPAWSHSENRLEVVIAMMSAPGWDMTESRLVTPETVTRSRALMAALRERGVAAPYLYPIGGSAGVSFEWSPGDGWEVNLDVEPDLVSADATNTTTAESFDFELPADTSVAEIADRLVAMLARATGSIPRPAHKANPSIAATEAIRSGRVVIECGGQPVAAISAPQDRRPVDDGNPPDVGEVDES